MARLDGVLASADREFVLLRVTRMRGINLNLFDFDYDLTWMAFVLDADERVLGRYGGRDADSPDGRLSLAGLRYALDAALRHHRNVKPVQPMVPVAVRTVDDYPAASRLPDRACVHCHQVYDVRRESLQAAGKWRLDELWVYPLPENVGITLERDRGDRVERVAAGSPADRAGLRTGDRLVRVNDVPIASFADLQYALHRAPPVGQVALQWTRDGRMHAADLPLAVGWRQTDLSWRWSLRGVDPAAPVRGEDLSDAEKQAIGLDPRRLAFRQGPFVSAVAEQAGVRSGDVVIGIDGRELMMTQRQFQAYVRLNYRVGDRVTINLRRNGAKIDSAIVLPKRTR